MEKGPDSAWKLAGLGAMGPDPVVKDKLMLFGQFVGEWDIIEGKYLDEAGQWVNQTGEVHWNWILDGKALQDVWMYHDRESGRLSPAGTTLRFYDSKKGFWVSIWVSPLRSDVGVFHGRKEGEEIVLELQDYSKEEAEGEVRWIFSEITPQSFRWRGEESQDEGKTWILKQALSIVRKGYP